MIEENNLKKATLLFLVKQEEGKIKEICLAIKKRGLGVNKWNGVGGKVENNETIEEGAIRETKEEIDVLVQDIKKVAEIYFYFLDSPSFNQKVYVYFSYFWQGEPKETEEMNPKWFNVKNIPYKNMWSDDIFWLPKVLEGKLVNAMFKFRENDIVDYKEVKIVSSL